MLNYARLLSSLMSRALVGFQAKLRGIGLPHSIAPLIRSILFF